MKKINVIFNTRRTLKLVVTELSQSLTNKLHSVIFIRHGTWKAYLGIQSHLTESIKIHSTISRYIVTQYSRILSVLTPTSKIKRHIINQYNTLNNSVSLQQVFKGIMGHTVSFSKAETVRLINTPIVYSISTISGLLNNVKLSSGIYPVSQFYNSARTCFYLTSHFAKARLVRRRKLSEWTGTFNKWSGQTLDDTYNV